MCEREYQGIVGAIINRITFDIGLAVVFEDTIESVSLRIEKPFMICSDEQVLVVDVENSSTYQIAFQAFNKQILRCESTSDAHFAMQLSDGVVVKVEPDEYESWHLSKQDCFLAFSVAGGGVAYVDYK